MVTPALLARSPTLDDTFGAYLLGTFLGFILYGILLYQVRDYYVLYVNDCILLKSLVAVMVLLQTVFGILNIHTCYHYLIEDYFAPEKLLLQVWSIGLVPLYVAITVVVAQSYFARRVYLVERRYRPIALLTILLFVAEIVLDAVGTAHTFMFIEFSDAQETTWLAAAASIVVSVADLLITTVLIIALRRSRTGFKNTDSMIAVITMYTINTGLLTGIVHVILWIVCIRYPSTLIYGLIGIVVERLYGNVLLATLNARISFSQQGMHTFGVVTEFPTDLSVESEAGGRYQPGAPTAVMSSDIIELKPWNMPQDDTINIDIDGGDNLKG